MRTLVIAVVLTLALGFAIKGFVDGSAATPSDAWQDGAESFDDSTSISQSSAEFRAWVMEQVHAAQGND
jgi:hypothetical protein